jgi:3'-5' exoribonuclease
MPRKFIEDITPGDSVEQPFLVRRKELRTSRSGSLYLTLELMDRTGVVSAKFWDASQVLSDSFAEDDFVMVKATSETYRDQLQLVVSAITRMEPTEVDAADFLPSTKKDVAELEASLREVADEIANPHLKALAEAFLDDEEFMASFRRAPAGTGIHHAYLGGLLEHTCGIVEAARRLAELYPMINRDLMLAGAIVHDVGKVEALGYERGFRYTDAGGLVGHITIGARMVQERAATIEEFPQSLLDQVLHLVLSHHGSHEFGAPILPATAEAVALHYLDNLDAKLHAFEAAMLDDMDPTTNWTHWNRVFERKLFKGRI